MVGELDASWKLATGTLWIAFATLALQLVLRKLRTIVFERAYRRHFPQSAPSDAIRLIRARLEIADFVGFIGVSYWMLAIVGASQALLFFFDPSWGRLVLLTMALLAFDMAGPMEQRPTGGWGREGLEELWQTPAPDAGGAAASLTRGDGR